MPIASYLAKMATFTLIYDQGGCAGPARKGTLVRV